VKTEWAETLFKKADDISGELTDIRRQIHRHPELGFKETATARRICEKLKDLGIPFRTGFGKTGVVGLIEGKAKGRTVGLRADMDALPVQEKTGAAYASQIPGVMHACGHDAHVACLLGAAALLKSMKDQLNGAVKLIFQPAEEIDQGAQAVISDGGLENPRPDVFFALHVDQELPVGCIGLREGPLMGAIDSIRISVTGSGGHGAMPHKCVDAVVAASAIVMNLQTAVSRRVDPVKPTVVSIGTIHGGEAENIIASRVEMTGTVRCLDPGVHKMIQGIIDTNCKNTAASLGAGVVVDYQRLIPPLINAAEMTDKVKEACQAILGSSSVKEAPISMLGDDFAFFLNEIPGCYFRLGAKNPNWEKVPTLHSDRFDLDERSLPIGASILAHAALLSLSDPLAA